MRNLTMPRKIIDSLIRRITHHISLEYEIGDRYLTVREIAEHFNVSLQTAHKAIRLLSNEKILKTVPKSGIIVISYGAEGGMGKKVVLLSNNPNKRFTNAFLQGVKDAIGDISVELVYNTCPDIDSLSFGYYLCGLDAAAIIAIGFRSGILGFYHAMREGIDVVSDIILDDLPILPAVQTDNRRHVKDAVDDMISAGTRKILMAGYYPEGNSRHQGALEAVEQTQANIVFVSLLDSTSNARLDRFFNEFDARSAVFSIDSATNFLLLSKFTQFGIEVNTKNFHIYDCEESTFNPSGFPAFNPFAPSLRYIGKKLAEKLISKWRTGEFSQPLLERV